MDLISRRNELLGFRLMASCAARAGLRERDSRRALSCLLTSTHARSPAPSCFVEPLGIRGSSQDSIDYRSFSDYQLAAIVP